MRLTIATCQFPISGNIRLNLNWVSRQMRQAHNRGADVAHFPETALSGYAGVEFDSFAGFDWPLLEASTRTVMALAKELKLWTILGSTHRLTGRHKPHNSLYAIDPRGRIVERYDKCFCTGPRDGRSGDLAHYSPGDHLSVIRIRGIPCGLQVCHDMRYQELYREYFQRGVRVVFHSYHNGHRKPSNAGGKDNIWGVIVPPTMQAYAANNHLWISANNTSERICCWPSFFVRPDGRITGRLPLHRAGVLISTVDTNAKLYDASSVWRDRAIRGVYHSGRPVRDARSACRTIV